MARCPAGPPVAGDDRVEVGRPDRGARPLGPVLAARPGDVPADRLDAVVGQLVGRERLNDLVVAVTDLVVREDGRVVAAAPAAGGRRHGRASTRC